MSYPNSDDINSKENNKKDEEFAAQKDHILKQLLEPDARMRLGNIKLVKPELANSLENYLVSMVTQGKIDSKITDEQLKKILLSIQEPKRDFKINRI
ncbi:MAG: DNA-binding protein [Nitrosopumilaceae archaeon]|nr:DNA-binding protein [Nitrosopumilaceae archaeon]NIT99920.1 DNA-binding protein [Nitrosopumilaceae archaeon]NIU86273.1 DNA-binding protein [Nitrosopumilaceae archaeon]NIV65028.1 DNA-binding protein [Nitrosopumilaceae archaeon]NIX60523.1 DNA-binding protein [Nitrosopumilaceae archaeon]